MSLIGDMVSLATLPARLAWRVGGASACMLRDVVMPTNGNGTSASSGTEPPTPARTASPTPARTASPTPARTASPKPAGPDPAASVVAEPAPPVAPRPAGPVHVDEEVVLVEEFAEAGAEDGAGAQISVEEPWEGYAGMTAAEIRRRLGTETVEAAATVQLYEAAHKGRSSVLDAAARRVRE